MLTARHRAVAGEVVRFLELRGGQRLDLVERGFGEAFDFPEVEFGLGVEPELGAVARRSGGG
jgi:hypothetical protein